MESNKPIANLVLATNNKLDALCQEFDGKTFYGLEYIVEDFFQKNLEKKPVSHKQSIDWFGLDD